MNGQIKNLFELGFSLTYTKRAIVPRTDRAPNYGSLPIEFFFKKALRLNLDRTGPEFSISWQAIMGGCL